MPGTNAGTGQPIHFRCAQCRSTLIRYSRSTPWVKWGWKVFRTGATRGGGRPGIRMLRVSHEYKCQDCGHVGWTRHKDILTKPLMPESSSLLLPNK
jgi:predicted RNA-binding Zn-ribbon protein involved in translation (DUF1610 family)